MKHLILLGGVAALIYFAMQDDDPAAATKTSADTAKLSGARADVPGGRDNPLPSSGSGLWAGWGGEPTDTGVDPEKDGTEVVNNWLS